MWIPTTDSIASIPCLRHKLTKELTAFGTKGQLFLFSAGDVRALIYRTDHEEIQKVPLKRIKRWAARLEIPADLKEQIALSERADRGQDHE